MLSRPPAPSADLLLDIQVPSRALPPPRRSRSRPREKRRISQGLSSHPPYHPSGYPPTLDESPPPPNDAIYPHDPLPGYPPSTSSHAPPNDTETDNARPSWSSSSTIQLTGLRPRTPESPHPRIYTPQTSQRARRFRRNNGFRPWEWFKDWTGDNTGRVLLWVLLASVLLGIVILCVGYARGWRYGPD